MQTIIICTKHKAKGAVAEETGMTLNPGSEIRDLAALVQGIDTELIHLCFQHIVPDNDEWQWDVMGLLELFSDAVMVGGALHDGHKIVDGPRVFGFGEGFDCPDYGRPLSDPGYGAKLWKPHTASAVPTGHCVIRASFIKQCMPELIEESVPVEMLGLWLGALALETQGRVIYSPYMHAKIRSGHSHTVAKEEERHFLSRFWHQIPDHRSYSPRLGLATAKAYIEVVPEENQKHLLYLQEQLMTYPKWLEMRLRRRAALHLVAERPARITLVTTIYEKTDMGLLDTLAESVMDQTVKAAQWVIVAHGPITSENMKYVVGNSAEHWHAEVIVEPQPLGIMRAMRRGLESANGEYIVPVDADDVLTADAIQILTSTIATRNQPDLIFSDEDLLVGGQPTSPYLRSTFDPVLNLDSSCIWHLCAIKRESALALALYKDQGATWCHDWDSVMRVANAGGRIEHVAEVLYHWRQHAGSTTNKAEGDSRSLDSVRYVLERHIASTRNPQHFYVAEFPVNRGARELYIARRPEYLPPYVWIGDATTENAHQVEEDGILIFASSGVRIESQQVLVEVARLLELHQHVGAVGGLVQRADGVVVDGCYLGNAAGMLESPWIGQASSYSGPYALAKKTQSVASTGNLLAFFRISALKQIGAWPLAAHEICSDTAIQWCGLLTQTGWNVAFSPLVQARIGPKHWGETSPKRSPIRLIPLNQSLIRYGDARPFQS
jgi:glycosyltransferase involved in cell wall biosynthesis